MSDIIINTTIILIVTVFGCIGGQNIKAIRRYGITLMAIAIGIRRKKKFLSLVLTWIGLILSSGYGEDSLLVKIFKKDWIVRIVYGTLLAIPFLFFHIYSALILLPVAFSFRSSRHFNFLKMDWLLEDIIRYSTLGYAICCIK